LAGGILASGNKKPRNKAEHSRGRPKREKKTRPAPPHLRLPHHNAPHPQQQQRTDPTPPPTNPPARKGTGGVEGGEGQGLGTKVGRGEGGARAGDRAEGEGVEGEDGGGGEHEQSVKVVHPTNATGA
jgi:hypothetical protein